MRLNSLFAAMLIFVTPRIIHAEIMAAPTLEWLVDHCVDSGIYRVTAVKKGTDVSERESYVLTFERQELLRGEPQKTTEQYYYQWLKADGKRPLVKVGDEFLICFQHLSNGDRIAEQLINLSSPQTNGPKFIAVSSDFKILKDREAIMNVFLKRMKRQPQGDPVAHGDHSKDNRVELDSSMEPYGAFYSKSPNGIYAGSACYLKIPNDLLPK